MEMFAATVALICAAGGVWSAYSAFQSARKAEHSEHRLAIMRGQVAGLEAAIMGLDAKHQKLAGRVYADQYWRGQRSEQPELVPIDEEHEGRPCEQWGIAQREGPLSAAAKCECGYCNAKRADRAARRAKLRAGVKT